MSYEFIRGDWMLSKNYWQLGGKKSTGMCEIAVTTYYPGADLGLIRSNL